MGFRTSRFWFPTIPLSCHPNYRALTFALAGLPPAEHTSLHWFATPGRSRFASPVGDHDCPCAIFPVIPWLKRSLAYTPCATGLSRSSIAVCSPECAGTESGMGDTPSTRHGREPLRTLEVLPLG